MNGKLEFTDAYHASVHFPCSVFILLQSMFTLSFWLDCWSALSTANKRMHELDLPAYLGVKAILPGDGT